MWRSWHFQRLLSENLDVGKFPFLCDLGATHCRVIQSFFFLTHQLHHSEVFKERKRCLFVDAVCVSGQTRKESHSQEGGKAPAPGTRSHGKLHRGHSGGSVFSWWPYDGWGRGWAPGERPQKKKKKREKRKDQSPLSRGKFHRAARRLPADQSPSWNKKVCVCGEKCHRDASKEESHTTDEPLCVCVGERVKAFGVSVLYLSIGEGPLRAVCPLGDWCLSGCLCLSPWQHLPYPSVLQTEPELRIVPC